MKRSIFFLAGIMFLLVEVSNVNAQNSVLSEGDWYKIAVEETGIHKITYTDLVNYGIDPTQINPQHIRLYGNGNGMLSESNSEYRYDDLQENAIVVYGEDDGVFNTDDYILFYGEGSTEWNYNDETDLFEHEINLYTDYSCYFITTDLGEGMRIENQSLSTEPTTYTSTSFNDYYYHELELENLLHSGKEWFGECFDETLEYGFEIEFPNLITTHPVSICAKVAARSYELNSSFNFDVNGQSVLLINVPTIYGGNYSSIAREEIECGDFYSNSSLLNLSISYNKPTDSAIGWLGYFTFNFKRENTFESGQMLFRDIESISESSITKFQISSINPEISIWNITDPLNPLFINYSYIDELAEFKLETDSLLTFIIFDNSQPLTPYFIEEVENQNLHTVDAVDMIIVTHPDFEIQAQQLANFRESFNGISTFVTTPEKIYNEFSSGVQDISAIRDFVKMMYDNSAGESPENLLLFGDATYDYKDIRKNEINYIPVWESQESLHPIYSYCTDDFYIEFDEFEKNRILGVGIGRLPVKSILEANAIVEKLVRYSSDETIFENWRNEIALIADDEDNNIYLRHAENIAELIDTTYKTFNISKIYLDSYEQDTLENGNDAYTEVNQAITDKVNDGVNIINYIGHGTYSGFAQERVFTEDDLENWENTNSYPFLFAATCNFGQFDDPDKYSLCENALLMEDKGLIAVASATRATYAGTSHSFQKNFYEVILENPDNTLGESIKLAKNELIKSSENRKYCLFGDPSMRLAIPEYKIITETINGVEVTEPMDTINPGGQVMVTGYISDWEGNEIYNLSGTLTVKVYDRVRTVTTLGNDSGSEIVDFLVQDSVLNEFEISITNGQFAFVFWLPVNLDEEYGTIKLSYYAKDGITDAAGHFSDIVVGGAANFIPENEYTSQFINFYPTVVTNQVNFLCDQNLRNLTVEVIDISGKIISRSTYDDIIKGEEGEIDVSYLQKGIYIFKAHSVERMNTFKIIKQ